MLYWCTQTIGSSIRPYALAAPIPPPGRVIVPSAVMITREPDLPVPPESWLRRAYPNLTRFAQTDEGGHFLALEAPEKFVAQIRDTFSP